MNNNEVQLTLFPEMENNTHEMARYSYQVRSTEDPNFLFSFNVKEDEDPETIALDRLGYFILSETNVLQHE